MLRLHYRLFGCVAPIIGPGCFLQPFYHPQTLGVSAMLCLITAKPRAFTRFFFDQPESWRTLHCCVHAIHVLLPFLFSILRRLNQKSRTWELWEAEVIMGVLNGISLQPQWTHRQALSGPLRLRVRSRSRTRLRIAASIAFSFRACFKGV